MRGGWGTTASRRDSRTSESFDGALQLLPRDVHERVARAERLGLEHRLSRRRPELLDPPGRADQGARSAGSRPASPNHLVVPLTDPFVYQCPFLLASTSGTLQFAARGGRALRAYFDKGGFIWVDDSGANAPGRCGKSRSAACCRPSEYPILDVPPEHPVCRTMFEVKKLPQIPAISHWRRCGGETSERGARDAPSPTSRPSAIARAGSDGADDAQHRHLRCVGARRRGPASSSTVLAQRLRASRSTSCSTR